MFSQINERLVQVKQDVRKKEKIEAKLADYQKESEMIEETIAGLRRQFESEKKDVDKLERVSLANLFATLSGKKEEKLSKEQQEMIVAQHKLEEAEKSKKEIEDAIQELILKRSELIHVEEEYKRLLREKENMIKYSDSPSAEIMLDLSEQEGLLKAGLTELYEAIEAGIEVDRALDRAIESLRKAENWGTWDMLGGGMVSSMIKHDHIDEAEDYLHKAQKRLRHFQKELLDVEETIHLEVGISGMLKFADFFFDDFIADFMVQGKIKKSLDQAIQQSDDVYDILSKLQEEYEEKGRELEMLQKQKREMIERL
ncbi:hypothetical protein [Falsibacillus albus]|uniref:Uncharacterized protein n=1 Tax=Falsibacillus albus TaxID=2478915 RepID=A0A3L7JWN5_9BACI|nr:hypothetical protein [Falsibacillus albus]RLQ94529.1 hypothetical protein D9X91_13380 [Falsibacillus albus]